MQIDTTGYTCPKCGGSTPILYEGTCNECWAYKQGPQPSPPDVDPGDFEYTEYGDERDRCHHCDGDGWGIVGLDWDSDDPINGPYPGETQRCPCCGGTGDAKDCRFW